MQSHIETNMKTTMTSDMKANKKFDMKTSMTTDMKATIKGEYENNMTADMNTRRQANMKTNMLRKGGGSFPSSNVKHKTVLDDCSDKLDFI